MRTLFSVVRKYAFPAAAEGAAAQENVCQEFMSWFSAVQKAQIPTESDREARRKKLEAERLARKQQRDNRQKQLQEAINAQKEADEALQSLLDIDSDIFSAPHIQLSEQEVTEILEDSKNEAIMDFESENGVDGKTALADLKAVTCPFMQDDIEFWFTQLESQLEVIEIKSQWYKRLALQRFLPPEIQAEIKSLLRLTKPTAGDDIYKKIKAELIELFGQKPEDAYTRAKNRVLTGKPSQLGKAILDDLCKKDKKLDGCCCGDIVWGMFREALPVVVRNHIAEMSFNKDTYKAIFTKADQIFDSNQGAEPLPPSTRSVAATDTNNTSVAAVQKSQKNKKNNKGQKGQSGQNQGQSQNTSGQTTQKENGSPKPPKKPTINAENLCKIHAKWKDNATFCAAPWGCKMKNVYRAPQ